MAMGSEVKWYITLQHFILLFRKEKMYFIYFFIGHFPPLGSPRSSCVVFFFFLPSQKHSLSEGAKSNLLEFLSLRVEPASKHKPKPHRINKRLQLIAALLQCMYVGERKRCTT